MVLLGFHLTWVLHNNVRENDCRNESETEDGVYIFSMFGSNASLALAKQEKKKNGTLDIVHEAYIPTWTNASPGRGVLRCCTNELEWRARTTVIK